MDFRQQHSNPGFMSTSWRWFTWAEGADYGFTLYKLVSILKVNSPYCFFCKKRLQYCSHGSWTNAHCNLHLLSVVLCLPIVVCRPHKGWRASGNKAGSPDSGNRYFPHLKSKVIDFHASWLGLGITSHDLHANTSFKLQYGNKNDTPTSAQT